MIRVFQKLYRIILKYADLIVHMQITSTYNNIKMLALSLEMAIHVAE